MSVGGDRVEFSLIAGNYDERKLLIFLVDSFVSARVEIEKKTHTSPPKKHELAWVTQRISISSTAIVAELCAKCSARSLMFRTLRSASETDSDSSTRAENVNRAAKWRTARGGELEDLMMQHLL